MSFWWYISVAAVAIAGTYILWGPSNRPKRKRKNSVPGLQNLGNSCFLNAVLQGLASCSSCIKWLHRAIISAEDSQTDNCLLIKSIMSVLSALNESEDNCSGAEVIKALRAHRWIISHEEHDAHELFHVLTTTVEEEILSQSPVLSLLEANKLEGTKEGTEHKKSFASSVKSLPIKLAFPMRGLLVNELKCNSCNYKYPAKYDTFDSISLIIPTPNVGKLTLNDLLLKFISCELIQDVVCEMCPKNEVVDQTTECTPKTTFSQQVSFGKLPECLCIHIQRTVWLKNGLSVKCYDYVEFPETLVMDPFVHSHTRKDKKFGANYTRLRLTGGNAAKQTQVTDQNVTSEEKSIVPEATETSSTSDVKNSFSLLRFKNVYSLKAVIVHLGDASSGHFITYRRVGQNKQTEKWFYTSDLDVKEVSFSEVSRACAYMLFYERIK